MTASTPQPADITHRWIARLTVAVAASIVLFGVLVFLLLRSDSDDAQVIGVAKLAWNEEVDDPLGEGKSASVEIIEEDGSRRVFIFDLEVLRTPGDFEFLEAWLVDDDGARLPIGSFDEIRTRLFALPDAVDPLDYDVVEFSLEPNDDDAAFSGRTLMRGDIVWITLPPDDVD